MANDQDPFPCLTIDALLPREDIDLIRRGARAALMTARRDRKPLHPAGTVGLRQYAEAHAEVGRLLQPTGRWARHDCQNFLSWHHLDRRVALVIGSGTFGAAAAPLVLEGIEPGRHRDRVVEETRDALARQVSMFDRPDCSDVESIAFIFLLLGQDRTRVRAELHLADAVLTGRLQTIECRPLIDLVAGHAVARPPEVTRIELPAAVPVDFEVEWLDLDQLSSREDR